MMLFYYDEKVKNCMYNQRFMAAFIYTHVFEMFFHRHCRCRLYTFYPRLRMKINKTFTLYFLIFTAIFSLYSFLIVYSLLCIFCCCNFYMVFEVSNIVTLCFEWARKCERKTLRLYKIKIVCLRTFVWWKFSRERKAFKLLHFVF